MTDWLPAGDNQVAARKASCISMIAAAIRTHGDIPAVVLSALRALGNICLNGCAARPRHCFNVFVWQRIIKLWPRGSAVSLS